MFSLLPARSTDYAHFGLTGLSTQAHEPAQYQLAAQVVGGGTISSRGSVSAAPLAAHGRLDIAAVAVSKVWEFAAPGIEPGHGQLQASAAYIYEDGDLVLQDVSIEAARFAYAGIELPQVALKAPRLALPPKETFELAATAEATPAGRISARGSLGLEPFTADVQLELANLVLAEAQRWLSEKVAVSIASGALSTNGNLRVEEADITYQGAASLRDVRFEEPRSGNLLLGWQLLHTQEAKLRFSPFDVEIGELVAHAPQGRLIIEADDRINFAEVIRRKEGNPAGKKPFEVTVRRLRVENGTLKFADRSLDNDFAVTIRELAGAITGFSTEAGNPGRVQLGGRVEKYGSARVRGTINLDAPKSLTHIRATFRNLDLAELTPYIVKFAGYRVESGRVSAELRYRVRNGRLIGQNQLVFEQMQLGEKVQSAGARDLPLELAVALLADSRGRINLNIPVSGNLNDPQFDFGGLIAKALGNVIGKIVSAPFRTLAALVGEGDTDLDRVRFEPGSVVVTPPAEENVAQVANALGQRPQLGVTVQGGYDPESDLAALRTQAVRREIAQRAGYDGKGPLDFSDPKVLHAAENQYLERVGNPLELQKLREAEPRYGRALVEKLAAVKPVERGTAETLAQVRAETVRAALLEHGLHPSCVRLEAPDPEEAGKEGVPTVLSLSAKLSAPQQAQRAPTLEANGDTVRQAQRRLNAEGFDVGPIDGILGPITQRGLARFQESRGLEATGELNQRTLAALGLSTEAATGVSAR